MSKDITSCHGNWESQLSRADKAAPNDFFDLSRSKAITPPQPPACQKDSYAASHASPYFSLLNGTSWNFAKKTA